MATLPLPPSGVAFIDPITGGVSIQWQNYLLALSTIGGGFAPIDAEYWVSTSNSTLTNETNLGALASGYLKLTTAAGVGTPSTVTSIPGTDITGAALSKTDDTNVTLTLGGTPLTALLRGVSLALGWTGLLGLGRGGTHADLSATGGTSQVLKQSSAGADVTVGQLSTSDISGYVAPAMTLLKTGNGTTTNAGAVNVDTIALSGLTAKDIIVVEYETSALVANNSGFSLYSSTDSTTLIAPSGGMVAGQAFMGTVKAVADQQSTSTYDMFALGAYTAGTNNQNVAQVAMATAFTSAWTLAFRSLGVVAGGTFCWRWNVYKLAGQ